MKKVGRGFAGWGVFMVLAIAFGYGCMGKSEPFKPEVYKSVDGARVVWLKSATVMRIKTGSAPEVTAKYSVGRDGRLRVRATVAGKTKQVYFKKTADGLVDQKGRRLYSSSTFKPAREKHYCALVTDGLATLAEAEKTFFAKHRKYIVSMKKNVPAGFDFKPADGTNVVLSGVAGKYFVAFGQSRFCPVAYAWFSKDGGLKEPFPADTVNEKITSARVKAAKRMARETAEANAKLARKEGAADDKMTEAQRNVELKKIKTGASRSMVFVKGGCFEMGSVDNDSAEDEKPVHRVCLNNFRIDKREVTQFQFSVVMSSNFSYKRKCLDCPVERVTWREAGDYCHKLGKRLPTEAQWEYSARDRGKDIKYATDQSKISEKLANYHGTGSKPVGSYSPSALGLYDMSGNVWEWISDWSDGAYYGKSPEKNPRGPKKGVYRVIRGGSWRNLAFGVRTTKRGFSRPNNRFSNIGFRCVQ